MAKSLRPNSKDRPYMKPEHALTGKRAWGKVDYLLVYRAFGIMVVEVRLRLQGLPVACCKHLHPLK